MSLLPTADLHILLRVFSDWKREPSSPLGVQSHPPTLYPPPLSTCAAGLTKMKPHPEAIPPLGCHCYLLQAYFIPLCHDLEPPLPGPGKSYCPNSAQNSSHLRPPTNIFPSHQWPILHPDHRPQALGAQKSKKGKCKGPGLEGRTPYGNWCKSLNL